MYKIYKNAIKMTKSMIWKIFGIVRFCNRVKSHHLTEDLLSRISGSLHWQFNS